MKKKMMQAPQDLMVLMVLMILSVSATALIWSSAALAAGIPLPASQANYPLNTELQGGQLIVSGNISSSSNVISSGGVATAWNSYTALNNSGKSYCVLPSDASFIPSSLQIKEVHVRQMKPSAQSANQTEVLVKFNNDSNPMVCDFNTLDGAHSYNPSVPGSLQAALQRVLGGSVAVVGADTPASLVGCVQNLKSKLAQEVSDQVRQKTAAMIAADPVLSKNGFTVSSIDVRPTFNQSYSGGVAQISSLNVQGSVTINDPLSNSGSIKLNLADASNNHNFSIALGDGTVVASTDPLGGVENGCSSNLGAANHQIELINPANTAVKRALGQIGSFADSAQNQANPGSTVVSNDPLQSVQPLLPASNSATNGNNHLPNAANIGSGTLNHN